MGGGRGWQVFWRGWAIGKKIWPKSFKIIQIHLLNRCLATTLKFVEKTHAVVWRISEDNVSLGSTFQLQLQDRLTCNRCRWCKEAWKFHEVSGNLSNKYINTCIISIYYFLIYIYIFLHEILHQLMSSLNIWISNLLWQCSEKWPQQLQLDSLSITLGSCVWIRQTFNASETNGDQQDPDISNQVHG